MKEAVSELTFRTASFFITVFVIIRSEHEK